MTSELIQLIAKLAVDLVRLESSEFRNDPLQTLLVTESLANRFIEVTDQAVGTNSPSAITLLALSGEYFSLTGAIKAKPTKSRTWMGFFNGDSVGPIVRGEIADSHYLLVELVEGCVNLLRDEGFESSEASASWADMGGVFLEDLRRALNVTKGPRRKRFSAQGTTLRPTF